MDCPIPSGLHAEPSGVPSRLEAATSRLEDIASSTIDDPSNLTAGGAAPHNASSTSAAVPTATASPAPAQPPPTTDRLPETIEEFDAFLASSVEKYVKLSNHLGGLLAEQASQVLKGFQAQRKFLLVATQAKKPDNNGALSQLLSPINEALIAVQKVKEANRPSPVFTQLSAVAEGIMVLAWVTVENRPFKHVEETLGSAQFFGNRVLKEQKDKYVPLLPSNNDVLIMCQRSAASGMDPGLLSGLPRSCRLRQAVLSQRCYLECQRTACY